MGAVDSMQRGNHLFFGAVLILLSFLSFSGCATQSDLETIQRDTNNSTKELLALQRNLYDQNAANRNLSTKLDALEKKIGDVRQEIAASSSETKNKIGFLEKEMETVNQPMRRYQAELGARIDKLQMEVQNLMGRFEESKYFAQKTFGETKTLKETYQGRIEDLDKRIAALNKSVEEWERRVAAPEKGKESEAVKGSAESGEEKSAASQPPPAKPGQTKEQVVSPQKEPESKKSIGTVDEAYKKAYDQFSKGNIEGAKAGFKKLLEVYPKSKYSENAHYWLGECYFAEKKYEEAILEFDEVIKKYPKGNKVPDALFRQGMAFLDMKDTVNAKLILKEVVKRFPKSDQANRARKKLKEMG